MDTRLTIIAFAADIRSLNADLRNPENSIARDYKPVGLVSAALTEQPVLPKTDLFSFKVQLEPEGYVRLLLDAAEDEYARLLRLSTGEFLGLQIALRASCMPTAKRQRRTAYNLQAATFAAYRIECARAARQQELEAWLIHAHATIMAIHRQEAGDQRADRTRLRRERQQEQKDSADHPLSSQSAPDGDDDPIPF